MGLNFQDVLRDVHDPSLHSLKTTASLSASTVYVGNPTLYAVVNTGAAGDPGTYIGLTTTTLGIGDRFIGLTTVVQASSVRSIVGNITLSDSKTYIGLTTATIGNSPSLSAGVAGIGFATVNIANTPAVTFSGNVTLDAGSKTQIVGNVTLSDAKTFIGLTTVNIGSSNTVVLGSGVGGIGFASVTPIAAWPDPKTYIGLVTITGSLAAASGNVTLDAGSKTGVVGNITLSDSKGFIGLTTVNIGSSNTVVLGTGVANIGFATVQPLAAWPDPKTYIGLVTITGALSAAAGNVTLDAGSITGLGAGVAKIGFATTFPAAAWPNPNTYIGLVTSTIGNSPVLGSGVGNIGFTTTYNGTAWPDPKTYIGLVTITGSLAAAAGNVTLDAGSKTQIVGNVTLSNSQAYIGLVTATLVGGSTISPFGKFLSSLSLASIDSGAFGPLMVDQFGRQVLGNPNTYIGLATVDIGTTKAWANPNTFIGLVTVDIGASKTITWAGNVTLSDAKTYIGLTTSTLGIGTQFIGLVTIGNTPNVAIVGNITLSDSKGFIGLVTVTQASSARTITGNVTLSDAKTYVGLTTTTLGIGTQFIGLVTVGNTPNVAVIGNVTLTAAPGSDVTVYATTISATGAATLFIAPASNRFFIKNLHVSSLGRSEIQFLSGATVLLPYTSLATTAGFAVYYGEVGVPARAQTDALVANLNGNATVSIGVTYRIAP